MLKAKQAPSRTESWANHPAWLREGQAVSEPLRTGAEMVKGTGPYAMAAGRALVLSQGLPKHLHYAGLDALERRQVQMGGGGQRVRDAMMT